MPTEFFIKPSESLMDKVVDPAGLVARNPEMADRFDAIKELRALDDGSLHRGNEFRRVANLVGPVEDLLRAIEPEFLRDKRKFYAWLDAHPEYVTYQRPSRATRAAQIARDIGHIGRTEG